MYSSEDLKKFLAIDDLSVDEPLKKKYRYLILGHKEPDGDCVASQVVMGHFLRRLGHEVFLLSEGPFDRPEIAEFESSFRKDFNPKELNDSDRAVVLDCSTPDRVGRFQFVLEKVETLVIDHHSSRKDFGDISIVDSYAPSVTYIIQHLLEELGHNFDTYEARLLLFGLCTDTGFFRHVEGNEVEIFSAVSRLVKKGVTLKDAFYMMYGNRDISKRKLLGKMLERVKSYDEGRILTTFQTIEDRARVMGHSRGDDELYMLLQTVRNNEVVVYIREEEWGGCSVGLRSRDRIDVGKIAGEFGGGGHRLAAGFDMDTSIEETERVVVERLRKALFQASVV